MQKYGPTVLAAPTTTGFNRVAWIMPFLALVLGLLTTIFDRVGVEEKAGAGGSGRWSCRSAARNWTAFAAQARKDTEI